VVRCLLAVHPFQTLYVADLDAIQRRGDNLSVIRRIRAEYPALSLWIDDGAADFDAPVIGSESQRDGALVARHRDSSRVVLSLDFRGDAFQGPEGILSESKLWPRRVIVMTLARVGGGAGPDLPRLAAIKRIAGDREIYAAGGVRDSADLSALKTAGAAGALIATALHDGRVVKADLDAI